MPKIYASKLVTTEEAHAAQHHAGVMQAGMRLTGSGSSQYVLMGPFPFSI